MAKRARDFFQSVADLMKGYLSDNSEEVKEVPKKAGKYKKKMYDAVPKKSKKASIGKKSNKDPFAPKKPLPAFLLFSNNRRSEMKEKNLSMQSIIYC